MRKITLRMRPDSRRLRDRDRGFTLLEVALSLSVIAVALGLLVSSMLSLTHSRRRAAEQERVATALSGALETLESLGPTEAWLSYAASQNGDPFPAPGSGPGEPFVIEGLPGVEEGAPAQVEVEFVIDETEVDPALGLPRDLDGDGAATNTNVAALDPDGQILASILPVRLTARWRSFNGTVRARTWSAVIVDN